MKADKQLTGLVGFIDPRSYVAPDGREVRYGEDWLARKKELWLRCEGRCERIIGITALGVRCGAMAAEPDHIIKRSIARDDRLENLEALCIGCHRAKHPEFTVRWSKKA